MEDIFIQEYIDYWGAGNLRRWPETAAHRTLLADSSKAFLVTVGMPAPARPVATVLKLDWDLSLRRVLGMMGRRLLAKYFEISVFVDENQGGRIVLDKQIPRPGGYSKAWPERYYNSSIKQFALSLTEDDKRFNGTPPYVDIRRGTKDLTEQEEKEKGNLRIFEARLRDIDAAALDAEDSVWAYRIYEAWAWFE